MEYVNMNDIVGKYHILFVCLDSLRYDVAFEEQERGGTPTLNRYGSWRKCQAPGNFTYPSHQAMFAGFMPVDEGVLNMKDREKLFFSEDIGMGRKAPETAFHFEGATWVEGLNLIGYDTYCIGGVSFFDKRTAIGKVIPGYFQHSYWKPAFGPKVQDSTRNQVDYAIHKLEPLTGEQKIMLYLNVSALHYPCNFYLPCASKDCKEAQAAGLRYVDTQLARLFDALKCKGDTFVICCSDHGTCFGEDGIWYHGVNHPVVNTVPYKYFLL